MSNKIVRAANGWGMLLFNIAMYVMSAWLIIVSVQLENAFSSSRPQFSDSLLRSVASPVVAVPELLNTVLRGRPVLHEIC